MNLDIDPQRFQLHSSTLRGFKQSFVYEQSPHGNGIALLCVHGWPESKRIFWKVIEPLVAAGFDVIVPAILHSNLLLRYQRLLQTLL